MSNYYTAMTCALIMFATTSILFLIQVILLRRISDKLDELIEQGNQPRFPLTSPTKSSIIQG